MVKLNDFNDLAGAATAHWDFCHLTAMDLVRNLLLRYVQNSAHYALYAITMCKSLHTNVNSATLLLYILRHYAIHHADWSRLHIYYKSLRIRYIKKFALVIFSRCAHRTFRDYVHCNSTLYIRYTMLSSHSCVLFALLVYTCVLLYKCLSGYATAYKY